MTSSDLSRRPSDRTVRFLCAALLALVALAALVTPRASALGDGEELWRVGSTGTGAGELNDPVGLASDPVTGDVFAVDRLNNRISEFTPWGNFVKAFGWDVAPGAVNEQQEVRVRASGGQFRLSFGADTTTDLAFNASGTEVETALNNLASISVGGGNVSVAAVAGNASGATPFIYVVVFKGSLAGTNVASLGAVDGSTPLSGGAPSKELVVRTRAEGSAGGTGLESCTAESGCKAGSAGSGAGQLANAQGIAVDAAGNLYVREVAFNGGNNRVQKFDAAGRFELMFGGEVDKTVKANRCTKADLQGGDVCGVGVAGAGDGQFFESNSAGIALGAGGKLFVGDVERIQRFDLEGNWELSVPVPGETVHDLAIAPGSGDFYAVVGTPGGTNEDVRILDASTGAEEGKLQANELLDSDGKAAPATTATQGPITTGPSGNVFARRASLFLGSFQLAPPVLQFDASHNQLAEFGATLGTLGGSRVEGLGTNAVGDLHVAMGAGPESFIAAFGPGPVSFESPPKVPPEISGQFASSVQRDSATVAAEINPHFFSDTHYYVQYGTGKCSAGACTQVKPLPPGPLLTSKTANAPLRAAGIFLEGLTAGTTYHYRFVAESGGGGPVYGIDPDGPGTQEASPGEGLEATFITPDTIAPKACPNDGLRSGYAAKLPDCRAYEMVSPIDKDNGDVKTLVNLQGFATSNVESAEDGSRLTYSSYRAFAAPKSAPFTAQLLASRGAESWTSEALDPPQGPAADTNVAILGNNFKDFSPNLCTGWLVVAAEPQLDPPRDAVGYPNVYRRQNCGTGKGVYAALVPVKPTIGQGSFYPEPQGASADGGAAIFRINDKLTADAASGPWQTYYASAGGLKLLCVLPSGLPSGGNCSGGTGGEDGESDAGLLKPVLGRFANVTNAISADGKRVYWTDSAARETGAGKLYLRINPGEEQSAISGGECTEAEKACTIKVSETASTKASRFLGASPDGSRALFEITEGLQAGNLYLFDIDEPGSSTLIAAKALGLAGTSEDLSRVYFVSEEALDGAAVAEEPNLYLAEGKKLTFIATLSDTDAVIPHDIEETIPSVTARKPIYRAAQATEDGSALVFISNASLTGYDNTDLADGEADSEVYLYETGANGPVCISCNPSRARPRGRRVRLNRDRGNLPAAATLTLATTMLHAPRAISADGKRLFFNSFDALLPRDTNGVADVYMWESAPDRAACAALGAELYVASAHGCLSLISSGESLEDSEFLDASQDGEDVFFLTNASLLDQDPGLFDIYDARVGGGLPAPGIPAPDCQGETCKSPATAPSDPTPASSTYAGPGDPGGKAAKKKHRKVSHKKKHRQKKHDKKKQSAKGRAAR